MSEATAPHGRPSGVDAARRVLVVDDFAAARRLVRAVLTRHGFAVAEARDGDDALTLLGSDPGFDLLIVDVNMPGVGGLEVTRRVRSAPGTAMMPVLLLTGAGGPEDRAAGLAAGATDVLVKPFEPQELVARVGAALR